MCVCVCVRVCVCVCIFVFIDFIDSCYVDFDLFEIYSQEIISFLLFIVVNPRDYNYL